MADWMADEASIHKLAEATWGMAISGGSRAACVEGFEGWGEGVDTVSFLLVTVLETLLPSILTFKLPIEKSNDIQYIQSKSINF